MRRALSCVVRLGCLWMLVLGLSPGILANSARAQLGPRPGLAPAAPPAALPAPRPATAPPAEPGPVAAPDASARKALPAGTVLFVCDGRDPQLSSEGLRLKLQDALGRELVSLLDPRARLSEAQVSVAHGDGIIVLRVTPPHRPEVWRQLSRDSVGADPVGAIARAVLEMFLADSFARLDAAEIQDPFCPPGLICVQANGSGPWPPFPEVEVLDPWDSSYQRFYGWDPFSHRYPSSAALTAPYPGRRGRAPRYAPEPYYGARFVPVQTEPKPEHADEYALNMLIGGGVHGGGAFFRYEVDLLRRFAPFDFGLAYIAGRGQPEPRREARRAIAAMLQRRYVASAFELDLGASFGTFFATLAGRDAAVRPYLRGHVTFALELSRVFDLVAQSDLATTFQALPRTGAVEYTLSLGLRHRM